MTSWEVSNNLRPRAPQQPSRIVSFNIFSPLTRYYAHLTDFCQHIPSIIPKQLEAKLGVFSNSKGFGAGRGALPQDSLRFPPGFSNRVPNNVPNRVPNNKIPNKVPNTVPNILNSSRQGSWQEPPQSSQQGFQTKSTNRVFKQGSQTGLNSVPNRVLKQGSQAKQHHSWLGTGFPNKVHNRVPNTVCQQCSQQGCQQVWNRVGKVLKGFPKYWISGIGFPTRFPTQFSFMLSNWKGSRQGVPKKCFSSMESVLLSL